MFVTFFYMFKTFETIVKYIEKKLYIMHVHIPVALTKSNK